MSLTIRDGFGQALLELGRANPNLMVVTADLGESLRLGEFKRELPAQFVEVGICEQNLIGVAAGLAMLGKTVVAASFAAFNPGRNWEQIRLSVGEQNLDVKIVGGHAGLATGADGATHQALEDLALMLVLPRMRVVVPADFVQASVATAAIVNSPGPAYLRLSRVGGRDLSGLSQDFVLGKGQVLRLGKSATIIACGLMVDLALEAAAQLEREEALGVQVINLPTLKPVDEELIIQAAQTTKALVTAEEGQLFGGLGSVVAGVVVRNYPVPVEMVGVADRFGQSGTKEELFAEYGLTVAALKRAVWRALEKSN